MTTIPATGRPVTTAERRELLDIAEADTRLFRYLNGRETEAGTSVSQYARTPAGNTDAKRGYDMTTIRDYYGEEHTVPGPWRTIEQIKAANVAAGHYFFSRATMSAFHSRIAPGIIAGRIIVTSEQDRSGEYAAWDGARRYSVRVIADDGSVSTVGPDDAKDTYNAFSSLPTARRWAESFVAGRVVSLTASWVEKEMNR